MSDLQIFQNPDFGSVRTLDEDGVILFCGKDVAAALGYKDTVNAMKQHCHGVVKRHLIDNMGREQEVSFIPESDLYRLIFSSKLPTAEKFTDWVTCEVLPAIRKHGAYMVGEGATATRLLTTDDYLSAAKTIAMCKPDRMPLIISLLHSGGFDTDKMLEDSISVDIKRIKAANASAAAVDTTDAGKLIADALKQHELTEAQFGELIGTSHAVVSFYIHGRRKPSADRYERIIKVIEMLDNSAEG